METSKKSKQWGKSVLVGGVLFVAFAANAAAPVLDLTFDRDEIRTVQKEQRTVPAISNCFSVAYWVMPLDRLQHSCSSRWEKTDYRLVASAGSGYFDGFRTGLVGTHSYRPFFALGGKDHRGGASASVTLPCDAWAHVAWIRTPTNIVCYVNGKRIVAERCTLPWTKPAAPFVVGPTGFGMPPLPMRLESLKVWDRALDADEICELTQARFPEAAAVRMTEKGRWAEARELYARLGDWKDGDEIVVKVPERRPPAAPPKTAHELFVAPDGDDAADGTTAHPLRSWPAAVARVRQLKASGAKGGVTVRFRGGEYPVSKTVELTAADSGTEEFPVVYAADGAARPVFTGAVELKDWERVTDPAALARLPTDAARAAVRVCDLVRAGVPFPKQMPRLGWGAAEAPVVGLYGDGEYMMPARYPNDSFLHATNIVDRTNFVFRADAAAGDLAAWAREPQLMGCGYWIWCWADHTVNLRADPAAGTFALTQRPGTSMGASWNPELNYFICNALHALDREGEWHLDGETGRLYAWPRTGGKRYELSVFERPFLTLKDVSHVQIRGLSFVGGRGRAVLGSNCRNVVFAHNAIRNFGGEGLHLGGIRDCTIYGNVLCGFGRAAMDVSGGNRKTLRASGIRIEGNDISHTSRAVRTYTPGLRLFGCGTEVVYNRFHDMPSSAMRLEGNDFLISMNLVEDVLLESGDQGAVDIWGNPSYQGNVYAYNVWRRIGRRGHGQASIRFDDRISGQLVYGNRFEDACDGRHFGAVQINGGRRNVIDNNVFVGCPIGVTAGGVDGKRWTEFFDTKEGQRLTRKEVDIFTTPYTERYPGIETLPQEIHQRNRFTRNVFVGVREMFRAGGANDCRRNWSFETLPKLDELARETCFTALPSAREVVANWEE